MRLSEIESTLMNQQYSGKEDSTEMFQIDALMEKGLDFMSKQGQEDIMQVINMMKRALSGKQQTILTLND